MAGRNPDFIIAGAPRSGTTWLYQMLDRHPDIYLAKPVSPEPKFFLLDELFDRGLSYYLATWFADVPEGAICGEKSTNYLESPHVPGRIHRLLPGVKLVFILRNPVERAVSNYRWSRRNGHEDQDLMTALSLEPERERALASDLRHARPHAYVSRGLYATYLRRFLALFDRAHILVLRYEDIATRGPELAARLHGFLGVAARPQDAIGLGIVNPSGAEPTRVPQEVWDLLGPRYNAANQELAELLGPDFQPWAIPTQ
jgi:hypothetical protein